MTSTTFTLSKSLDPASYPKLKPGVNYFKCEIAQGVGIYIGFAHRGIELSLELTAGLGLDSSLQVMQLLKFLNGSLSLENIYRNFLEKSLGAIEDQVIESINEILMALNGFGLLEFRTTQSLNLGEKTNAPVNLVNANNRMRTQENLYSWHPQVSIERTTESLISGRRNFAIIIFGRNRLALSLFSILAASGFSQIKIIDRSISTAAAQGVQIAPDEVCGLAIRGSDVGLRKELVLADLARNSKLFPDQDLAFPVVPNFIISTEPIPQETLQRWMSEAIPHFVISNLLENKIEIGPIVIPGFSPCLNCLELWRREQFPHHNEFELLAAIDGIQGGNLELPSAQVALLSGIIAIEVIEFCSSWDVWKIGRSELVGVTKTIDLFKPMSGNPSSNEDSGNRYWQPHNDCGCQQLL